MRGAASSPAAVQDPTRLKRSDLPGPPFRVGTGAENRRRSDVTLRRPRGVRGNIRRSLDGSHAEAWARYSAALKAQRVGRALRSRARSRHGFSPALAARNTKGPRESPRPLQAWPRSATQHTRNVSRVCALPARRVKRCGGPPGSAAASGTSGESRTRRTGSRSDPTGQRRRRR